MTRPSLYPCRIIFDTDKDQRDALEAYASERKVTRAEAIRALLRVGLKASD